MVSDPSETGYDPDALIGRCFHLDVFGAFDREHPVEDAIADAAMDAVKAHGFNAVMSSGPLYRDGDEQVRKLAKVEAERDRLRSALEMVLGQYQQALSRDGMTHLPYYRATLDFPQMDAAREALEVKP